MKKVVVVWIILLLLTGTLVAEESADGKVKALEEKLAGASGKEKIETLNELAYECQFQSPEKSISYARQALKLAGELKDTGGEASALKMLSVGHRWLGNNDKALEYIQKALKMFIILDDKKNMAASFKELGLVYLYTSVYNKALEYLLRSLEIAEEINDDRGMANAVNNIGVIYFNLKNFDKSLEYYSRALKIEERLGDTEGIAECYYNIGMVHLASGNQDAAMKNYLGAMKIYDEIGDIDGQGDSYMNLGLLYAKSGELEVSEDYLLKSLKIVEKTGWKWKIAVVVSNLGECYLMQKKYDQAENYLKRGLRLAKKAEMKEVVRDDYRIFSELYETTGNYKKALEFQKLYYKINEEMFNEKSTQQIAEMQTRYDTLKKEKEIELLTKNNEILQKNNEIQTLTLSREKVTRYALITGLLMVLIIVGLLFNKYLYLFSFWKKHKYVGRYRLEEEIGTGGMGTVYKAHSIRDKTDTAAVKVLKQELFADETSRIRFKQEASIIEQLEHRNIVKVIERGEYKDKLFIAMELLKGKTLDVKIENEGRIALRECYHIMLQMCDALKLIHSKDIIHRDVKPSNVMLIEKEGDANFVKLMDFGLARMPFHARLTVTGILIGTINYMSPEQVAYSECSPAGDVYSMGVTIYEMITGRAAFPGNTAAEIMKQVLDVIPVEPNRFRPGIPQQLNDLIMKMIAKEKEARPQLNDVMNILLNLQTEPGGNES